MNTEITLSDYLSLGWSIFPVHTIADGRCTCVKGIECGKNSGKHPRITNGVNGASSDEQTVRAWWTQWPGSNIGLACGRQSGVIVIDIDPRHGGFESMEEYESFNDVPPTLAAASGGGGMHLFFSYPRDGHPIGNRTDWLPGVDVRSDGGYVILAPSRHISGANYSWTNWGHQIAPAPQHLLQSIRDAGNKRDGGKNEQLTDTASILNGVPEGSRDDTLFKWACSLRRKHESDKDGGRAVVTTLVLEAARNSKPPFPEEEARKCIDQAFKQDHLDHFPGINMEGVTDEGETVIIHHVTDMGNRDRFIKKHGANLRYVPELGWLRWTESGWKPCSVEAVLGMAECVPEMIRQEADLVTDSANRKMLLKWSMASEQAGALSAVERLARSSRAVLRNVDQFDTVLTDLACANGIVDLRTGQLRPHTREDLNTKNTGIVYDPLAYSKQWDDFLKKTTDNNTELMDYLQRAAGYSATGLNTQECFFIISGPPQSGKSTYIDGITTALGEYTTTTQSDTFMYRRGKDAPQDELARFMGMRIVTMAEIREGEYFNEVLIKQITGGDQLKARMLYKMGFTFRPQLKLWIATNHEPISSDDAMTRRIKRIRFNHQIPMHERRPGLKLHVKDKNDGAKAILRWIVEGAIQFLNDESLNEPSIIATAAAEYRMTQDVFLTFINEECRQGTGEWCYLNDIYMKWSEWCTRSNEYAGRLTVFRQKLVDKNFEVQVDASNNKPFVTGLSLKNIMIGYTQ